MTTATDSAVSMRAFRFALDPNPGQLDSMRRHVGNARLAFNFALGMKISAHQEWRDKVKEQVAAGIEEAAARKTVKVRIPGRFDVQKYFNKVRGDNRVAGCFGDPDLQGPAPAAPWFHEVGTYAFQASFADADAAWKNWLDSMTGKRAGRPSGYPRFKKKGRCRDSVRIHHDANSPTIRLDGYRHLQVPRIGSIRLHQSGKRMARLLDRTGGKVQSVTISRSGERWYAAVLVQYPARVVVSTKAQRAAGTVGVDLGVSRLATLSTGESYANPRHLKKSRTKLARAQRALSRTEKGSARRTKAITRVAKLHHHVAEQRSAALHQITKKLAAGFAAVAVEDLNVAGMTRSAKGTKAKLGKKVRQKAGLNREILDASFGEFRRQLTYKTSWYGSQLHLADRFFPSSKTCSTCGTVKPKLTLQERVYRCDPCGTVIDRDLNAAINIAHTGKPATPAVPVADDRSETKNVRRAGASPTPRGRQPALKRKDPPTGGPPIRSDPDSFPRTA